MSCIILRRPNLLRMMNKVQGNTSTVISLQKIALFLEAVI